MIRDRGGRAIEILLFVLLISMASAIKINEVEMNPVDGKEGIEWVELYNDGGEVDISLWELYDGLIGPKNIFTIPSGIILGEGEYYVAELSKTVLNNDGDFVTLYNLEEEEIDKTQMIKETKWSIETWQWCGDWKLAEATKGEENDCEKDEEPDLEFVDMAPEDLNESEGDEGFAPKGVPPSTKKKDLSEGGKDPINNVISLNPKDIKSYNEDESPSKTKYFVYSFVLFCVLLIVLFIIYRKNGKDEFD
jgi:hypothetical protein